MLIVSHKYCSVELITPQQSQKIIEQSTKWLCQVVPNSPEVPLRSAEETSEPAQNATEPSDEYVPIYRDKNFASKLLIDISLGKKMRKL
jgi:hypothetical protein